MKTKPQFEHLMESPEFRKLFAIEGLVTEAGELIAKLMQEQGVSRAELARRLGKSRAYITQMLSGSANLTVRTLAEVAYALGAEVKLEAVPIPSGRQAKTQLAPSTPVWNVIEIQRPSAAARPHGARPGLRLKSGHQTASAFPYVA
jgi:transcriptional regulator with XRE-family HTH domain